MIKSIPIPAILWDEPLRLMFPFAAAHAVLWPLLWLVLAGPFVAGEAASLGLQRLAYEMLFGTFLMAALGFLVTSLPRWTGTKRLQPNEIALLIGLWLPGRLLGLVGLDIVVTGLTDAGFALVAAYRLGRALYWKRSGKHGAFAVWALGLGLTCLGVRYAWLIGDTALSARLLMSALSILVIIAALALSQVNVNVVNLALDPSGETTPYRPHPGRQNLAAGLVAVYLVGQFFLPLSLVPAFLALGAAAAFCDRLAEWFIGPSVFKAQVLGLLGSNLAGAIGFGLIGLSGLGLPVSPLVGQYVLLIGSLGLAFLSIFSIGGLLHTGRKLILPYTAHWALGALALAAIVGALALAGLLGALSQVLGLALAALAFSLWLKTYFPIMAGK